MKDPDLKTLAEAFKAERSGGPDNVKVLVALRAAAPEQECLSRLQNLGLRIEHVVHNKLYGTVARHNIPALRNDPDVLDLEESVPLKRTPR